MTRGAFRGRASSLVRQALLVVASGVAWACGGEASRCCEPSGTVATLRPLSGDEQVGPVGSPLPQVLAASLASSSGPLSGAAVRWSVEGAGGTLAESGTLTGADGRVTTRVVPTGVGVVRIAAVATGSGVSSTPAVFTAFGVPGGAAIVLVGNNFFEPAQVSIARGGTVAWVWRGASSNHNVVPLAGTEPSGSGGPQGGPALHTHTFATTGTYRYRCTPHSGMEGTVVVN